MTPIIMLNILVNAGRTIDRRFPGLRESDHHTWMRKVAYFAHLRSPRIGLKSAHGTEVAISGDTAGILPDGAEIRTGQQPFFAVSIIRDNPPVNEWRSQPLDYGLVEGQYWIIPDAVDIGAETEPEPKPEPEPEPKPEPEPGGDAQLDRIEGLLWALGKHLGAWQ